MYLAVLAAGLMLAAGTALAAGTHVEVNADGVLLIDGRKVFPIGFSNGPPYDGRTPDGKHAFDELRAAGTHFLRTGATNEGWTEPVIAEQQRWLDAAAAHGLYCWINLWKTSSLKPDEAEKEALLRSLITRFKDHPGLLAWKNYDEAFWNGHPAEDLVRGYHVIREIDRRHPVIQTHAPRGTIEDLRPYNACADMLTLDIYPLNYPPGGHSLLPNKEISMVGDWSRFLVEVGEGRMPSWMNLQIAWSGVVKEGKTLRFPTFAQQRFMTYQAIINGMRGLIYFGGHVAKAHTERDAELGWNWTFWQRVLRPVIEEIGEHSPLAPALVAPDSDLKLTLRYAVPKYTPPVSASADTPASPARILVIEEAVPPELGVEFCVREVNGDLYILACKREGPTVQVTFSGLPAWAGHGDLLYEEPRTVQASDGQFTDWFGPFEVHVYRFRGSLREVR